MSHLDDADRTQVLNALKRAVNGREGWDQPSELGHIYRADNGRMRTRAFPVPKATWDRYGHPARLLDSYRSLLASPRNANQRNAGAAMRAAVFDSLMGMYLVTEGWSPPPHKVRALYEAEQRGESTPRFKDMPDRVEVRIGTAVDRDGALYSVSQYRPDMVLHGGVDTLSGTNEVSGRIPELLFGLTTLLLPQRA